MKRLLRIIRSLRTMRGAYDRDLVAWLVVREEH